MNEKYYTPTIEEFHVGFEYEQASTKMVAPKKWNKEIFYLNDSHIDIVKYSSLDENVRVKYLDKEDVENLGFEIKDEINVNRIIYQNKKDSFLRLSITYKELPEVSLYHYGGWETTDLIIKNKSELKKLLQQLKIIE